MYDHQALSRHRSQYPDTLCAVPSVDTLRSAVAVLVRYGRKTMVVSDIEPTFKGLG